MILACYCFFLFCSEDVISTLTGNMQLNELVELAAKFSDSFLYLEDCQLHFKD